MGQDKQLKVNRDISNNTVILINSSGKNIGNVRLSDALNVASSSGLDLVEVGRKGSIPVCRVMDYGKWKYEQTKKNKKNKSSSIKQDNKEIKLRPNTGDNDLQYRAEQVSKFLKGGHNIKICVRFKGREIAHMFETGQNLLEKFLALIPTNYKMIGNAKAEGRNITQWIGP